MDSLVSTCIRLIHSSQSSNAGTGASEADSALLDSQYDCRIDLRNESSQSG